MVCNIEQIKETIQKNEQVLKNFVSEWTSYNTIQSVLEAAQVTILIFYERKKLEFHNSEIEALPFET